MNKNKFVLSVLFALAAFFALPLTSMAQDEEPIITFKTTLYEDKGESNAFSLAIGAVEKGVYVDIDCGYGAEELEVDVAALEDSGDLGGSFFSGKVSKEGVVKIYGDPTKIDYFNASGCYITDIEFHKDLNLQILNLEYNSLKTLNVDNMKELQVLWLCDNPFTKETPLKIGRLEKLLILDIAQVGYVSPDFDLKNFPSLMTFNAFYATTLKTADTSKCPNLVSLSLDMTAVESVDVSQNPYLSVLNVADSRVKSFDITKNPRLTELYFGHQSGTVNTDIKVDAIDVTQNPELYIMYGGGNNLKTLDISKNPKLMALSVPYNYLETIDVSNNPDLYTVNLSYNNFGFSTLPADPGVWNEYYYEQRDFILPDYIKVGDVIDFSEKVLRAKSVTLGRVYFVEKDNPTSAYELDASYYTYEDGKVTFLKPVSKQCFIEYSNSELGEFNLRTEFFTVRSAEDYGKDIKYVDFASGAPTGAKISMGVGVVGASKANPVVAKVDFGDGELKSFTITDEFPTSANISGTREGYQNFAVYLPQGNYVSSLAIKNLSITNISLTELTKLENLELPNTELYSIDLSYNANLKNLDLSGNYLKTLSLKGPSNYFYKSQLHDVNISNNQLETLELDDYYALHNFNIANNKFTEIDLSDADNLISLDASGNLFESLVLTYSEQIKSFNAANNNLTELYIPATAPVEYMNISGNKFTLSNMPENPGLDESHFIYAPQQAIEIATTSPGVDLTDQFVTIDGKSTQFEWKRMDGGLFLKGMDYTVTNGATKFLSTNVGKVYCEITHPSYPAFTGANVLKTTYVTPIDMPKCEIASFVTTTEGEEVTLSLAAVKDGTSVYFDWAGDGNVSQYTLGTTYRRFYPTTKGNVKVRVLVADEADKLSVFSISGATMSDIDLSKLADVPAITVADAGLETINVPASNKLNELNLSGNKLTSFDISKYPNLMYISLNSNSLQSIDLSAGEGLQLAYLGNNKLTEVTLKNPNLWNLDLANNKLENISFEGCPFLSQVWLTSNQFKNVDITPVKNTLQVLNVVDNKLSFATLPRPTSRLTTYSYGNQAPLTGTVSGGKVDFSAEASVDGTPTTFRWFIGDVYVDENDSIQGEELYIDEEYTIENGVTTFLLEEKYTNLVCIMTNSVYPNLMQYTDYVTFDPKDGSSSIQNVRINTAKFEGKSFRINGQPADENAKGIIIKDGKKYFNK